MPFDLRQPAREDAQGLSMDDCLAHKANVSGKLRAEDKELFEVKWWDYRFMTPLEATLLYVDTYTRVNRQVYAREIDSEKAPYIGTASAQRTIQGILDGDSKSKSRLSAFWRGRQVADALGMPYEHFIENALTWRMRNWQQRFMPSASQLYLDWIVEKVAARWDELRASRAWFAEHDAYHPGNFQGLPVQVAYFENLIESARRSSDFSLAIADMIRADRLPYEFTFERLGGEFDRVQKALS